MVCGVQAQAAASQAESLLSRCCVTFYCARQANANLWGLAITGKKRMGLSSVNSTLTSQLVPYVSGMLGNRHNPRERKGIHGPLLQGQLSLGCYAAPLVSGIC